MDSFLAGLKEGLMGDAYLLPVLAALVSFLLGFFLKAFFATKGSLAVMSKKLDDIRKAVLEMQKESAADQKDSSAKNAVESLAREIRHSKEHMDRLQRLTLRFEETIDLLQREAEAIRTLILTPQRLAEPSTAAPIRADSTPARPVSPPPTGKQEAPARAANSDEDSDAPAWQKTLNNLLGQIDKREED